MTKARKVNTLEVPVLTVAETEVFNSTSPTSWTDLDLSGTVGANAALVLLKIQDAAASNDFAVRKNGDGDEFEHANAVGARGCAYAEDLTNTGFVVLLVATDTAGKIEWISADARTVTIDIIAYIK